MNLSVSFNDLINGFSSLGVKPGSAITVHSSLSSFGAVEGGAESVVNALKQCVGTAGLIVMPVFTYGNGVYDRKSTPSQTGMVTEVFRLSKGVFRSGHPTHSVACWGKDARDICDSHEPFYPVSTKSPFYELYKMDGDILLMGVDHTASSMIHLAQFLAGVPYLRRPKNVLVSGKGGAVKEVEVSRAGCSLGFNKIEKFIDKKFIWQITIGKSAVKKMKAKEVVDKAAGLLRKDPAALFCEKQDCFSCNEARQIMAKT